MAYMFDNTATIEEVVETVKDEDFWHILSVDDEKAIQDITKLVLSDFTFEGKNLKIFTADSASEAISFLKKHHDIALVLLDIVMESDDAGFEVARFLRNEQKNHSTRIVIRTGQPGSFPEETVIQDFDIDGFAEKTDLTKQRLSTIVYSTLRAYRDIMAVESCKLRLSSLIHSINNLSEVKNFSDLEKQLKLELNTLVYSVKSISLHQVDENKNFSTIFPKQWEHPEIKKTIIDLHTKNTDLYDEKHFISYHTLENGNSLYLFFELDNTLCDVGYDTCCALANSVYLITKILLKEST